MHGITWSYAVLATYFIYCTSILRGKLDLGLCLSESALFDFYSTSDCNKAHPISQLLI